MRMKKAKSFKRMRSTRLLLSLVTCSFVLVAFSATVYAMAVPGVLASNVELAAVAGMVSGDGSLAGNGGALSDDAQVASLDDAGEDTGSFVAAPLPEAPTFDAASAVLAPVLQGAASQISDTSNDVINNETNINQSNDGTSNLTPNTSGVQSPSAPETEESPFDAETEEGFHKQLVEWYAKLPSYYAKACEGLDCFYTAVNNASPSSNAAVGCGDFDSYNFVTSLTDECNSLLNIRYNGIKMTHESKWYDEQIKIWSLYDNVLSIGCMSHWYKDRNKNEAVEIISDNTLRNGKLYWIDKFEQDYPKVQL